MSYNTAITAAAATGATSKCRIQRNVCGQLVTTQAAQRRHRRALTSAGARKLNVNRRNDAVSMMTSRAVADDDDMFATKSTSNTRGLFGKPAIF